ncbi:MAG: hypothetical protein FJW20_25050 [Acidimicrobiia bacterium]|nr:hypothetical protein [Acidimicrobiia bacterium]
MDAEAILAIHGSTKSMYAIIIPNASHLPKGLDASTHTVQELESLTGLGFFAALEDSEEALLESTRQVLP